MIPVLLSIVAWVKKWGAWVAGLAVAVYVLFRRLGSGRAPGPTPLQKKVETKTAEIEKKAEEAAVVEKARAAEVHEQGLVTELGKEEAKTTSIESAPDQVNDYLRDAGEAARREPK